MMPLSIRSIFLPIFLFLFVAYSPLNARNPQRCEEAFMIINHESDPAKRVGESIYFSHLFFMRNDMQTAHLLLDNALQDATRHGLDSMKVIVHLELARTLKELNQIEQGIEHLKLGLSEINAKTENFKGKFFSFLGWFYSKKMNIDSASKYFVWAESWNANFEPYRNWVLYDQWQGMYVRLNDLDQAEKLLRKAYNITKPLAIKMDHGVVLYRLAQIASRKNDISAMSNWMNEYYDLVGSSASNMIHGLELGKNLSVHQKIELYEKLLTKQKQYYFDRSNSFHSQLASLYLQVGKANMAIEHLKKVDTTDSDDRYKMDYFDLLGQATESAGLYKYSLYNYRQKERIQNRINQQNKLKQMRDLEEKYKLELKEKELLLLQKQDELKTQKLDRARFNLMMSVITLFSLFTLCLAIIFLYLKNKKQNLKLVNQNKIIKTTLEEKDMLLHEVHHRVKNNLQIISSLLSLQSNYITDEDALNAFNEGKNRVNSMALIHQKLYKNKNVAAIDCHDYFETLLSYIFDSFRIEQSDVGLEVDIENMKIDVDTMIPIGLIVNELVCNVLKHAFDENAKDPQIKIVFKRMNNFLRLAVIDNGKGVGEDAFFNSNSFGNKIISIFKEKLQAGLRVVNHNGTSVEMSIRNYKIVS